MTILVVCMIVVFAWLVINIATMIWLAGISDEQDRHGERLDALEGLRGGLDVNPPLEPQYEPVHLLCRRNPSGKEPA
jgi:hypothetical protein